MSDNQSATASEELDAAIDRAVRRMVRIDPPAGLGRRVQERLTAPAGRRSVSTRYLTVAAIMAMLVIAVGLLRPGTPREAALRGNGSAASVDARQQSSQAKGPIQAPETLAPTRPVPENAAPHFEARLPSRVTRAPHAPRRLHSEVIPMPEVGNVFGEAANTVAGATVTGRDERGNPDPAVENRIEITLLSIPPLGVEQIRITEIPAGRQGR
jgi:hypothetical protein